MFANTLVEAARVSVILIPLPPKKIPTKQSLSVWKEPFIAYQYSFVFGSADQNVLLVSMLHRNPESFVIFRSTDATWEVHVHWS